MNKTPQKQTIPFSDYYVFQFQDATFRIAAKTEHQWNGRPNLPREILDGVYETRRQADDALKGASLPDGAILHAEFSDAESEAVELDRR